MNTYDEIQYLVEAFNDNFAKTFQTGIMTHIERAEFYFNNALDENDDQYFTDIIYRCNHAYEGVLKEAYSIFTGKNSENLTPNEIEKYFLEEKIFKDRVKNLFSSYRNDWRNPSTHDYKLFFTKEEAFMAILSVSSFIYLLLSQLLESKAYQDMKGQSQKMEVNEFNINNILTSLSNFSRYLKQANFNVKSEKDLQGYLLAYLEAIFEDVEIVEEFKTNMYSIDIAIMKNGKLLTIIEIKRYSTANMNNAFNQIWTYMDETNCDNGIIYLYDETTEDYNITCDEKLDDGKKVFSIYGKKLTPAST